MDGELKPLNTLVEIGSKIYAKAKVDDPTMIFIAIGLGFYVEFTLEEAYAYLTKKIRTLTLYNILNYYK